MGDTTSGPIFPALFMLNVTSQSRVADNNVAISRDAAIVFIFGLTAFLLHFASTPFFFLYEDDYFHIGLPATQSFPWIWEQIKTVWVTWPQGRPLYFTVLALEGGWIKLTGSVAWGYVPALLIITANAYLSYRLLRKIFGPSAGLLGAFFSLLSCADPHKTLLTHMPLQLAITANLAGTLLYLRGRPILAYLIAGSSLLVYEITFALFAGAEFLRQRREGRVNLRRLALAAIAWFMLPISALAGRFLGGESRAVEAAGNISELVTRILTNIRLGPYYGIENSYFHPISHLLRHTAWWPLALSVLLLAGITLAICLLSRGKPATAPLINNPDVGWLLPAVLIIWFFGPYALQLKRTVFEGFMRPVTGYHLCLGVAIGLAVEMVAYRLGPTRFGDRLIFAALIFLGGVSAYQNMLIQYDYARSSRYQAHFWQQVRRLAADAEPGDVILIPRERLLENTYILSNSWGVTHTWIALFKQTGPLKSWFSIPETRPVTVFFVPADWQERVSSDAGEHTLNLSDYTPPGFRIGKVPLVDGHVIVLDANYSEPFYRREGIIQASGFTITLKPVPAGDPKPLPYTPLARYLFNNFIN